MPTPPSLRVLVLVLAVGVSAAACGGGDGPSIRAEPIDPSTTTSAAEPTTSTTAATSTTTAPLPPGTIRYQGLRLSVPADWPVYDLAAEPTRCARADVHAVYLGSQGPNAQCPADGSGITESAQLALLDERSQLAAQLATTDTTINGLRVRVDPDPDLHGALTAVFPDQGVVVVLSFASSREVVDRILASVTAAP